MNPILISDAELSLLVDLLLAHVIRLQSARMIDATMEEELLAKLAAIRQTPA